MLNNNNKISLISWFCTLDTEKIILSGDDKCIAVTYDSTEDNVNLKSNQEETGTKVILHSMNVIRSGGDAAICSPSGDTDIMVLVLAWYHGIPLLEMITFQPSFVREKPCWSTMKSNESFLTAFTELATDWDITEQQVNAVEQYVCALYKSKKKSVNDVRYERRRQNNSPFIDSTMLFIPLFANKTGQLC